MVTPGTGNGLFGEDEEIARLEQLVYGTEQAILRVRELNRSEPGKQTDTAALELNLTKLREELERARRLKRR